MVGQTARFARFKEFVEKGREVHRGVEQKGATGTPFYATILNKETACVVPCFWGRESRPSYLSDAQICS